MSRIMNKLRQRRIDRGTTSGSSKPDNSMSVGDIKKWLDDNGIVYTGTHNTKPKLLALVNA